MRGVADLEAGWASAHSVPHVLTLDGDTLVASPHPDLDAYRAAPTLDLAGTAVDIEWSPEPGSVLEVMGSEFSLTADGAAITATGPDGEIASGPYHGTVRVIVDAQAVELSSPAGLIGFSAPTPAEQIHISASGTATVVPPLVRPLVR